MSRAGLRRVVCLLSVLVAAAGASAAAEPRGTLSSIFFDGFETGDTVMWSNGAPALCDAALPLDDPDPLDGAAALGVCQVAGATGPGLIAAQYQRIDGVALPAPDRIGIGLLGAFGPNVAPVSGARFLGLSTGTARSSSDPGYISPSGFDRGNTSNFPPGLPEENPWCPGVITSAPHDSTALVLTLRTPANAQSLSVALKLYAYGFTLDVCGVFADWAVLLVDPPPVGGDPAGNVAVDSGGNFLGVNTPLLQVCTATSAGGHTYSCPLGTAELSGTGFEGTGATGWIRAIVPVPADTQIQLTFAVWDSGDGQVDSTLLVDDLRWSAEPASRIGLP